MTRARELARLANENVFTAEDYNSPVQVGINSTDPTSTLDVRGELKVGTAIQAGTAGVVTATEFSGSIGTFSGAGSFGGNLDVTGNVTVGGTLTYEDVTNIDSVGVITARAGVNVSGGEFKVGTAITFGSAGVSTFFGAVNLNKKTTVNATLEATEGLNVTAGVSSLGGNAQFTAADPQLEFNSGGPRFRAPSANTLTYHSGGGLGSSSNERFRVTSSGDVGINGTPTNTDMAGVIPKLYVAGISTSGQFNTVARFVAGSDNNDTGAAVVINQVNDRGLVIQGGRGGDADGVHHANSGLGRFSIINNSGTFHKFMEAWGQNGQYVENISLFTGNDVERLRIASDGKVGINSSVPAALLDVQGDAIFNDRVYWKSSGTTKMSTLASNAGMNWQDSVKAEFGNSGDLKIYHESNVNYIYGGSTNFPIAFMTNATERLRIKGNGETNIGTGATTIAKFCLTGASNGGHQIVGQASNNVAALDVYSQHGSDANKLSFAVSDNRTGSKSNSFVIRGTGNIGINSSQPVSKVDIVYATSTNSSTNNLVHLKSDPSASYQDRGLFIKIGRDGNYDNSAARYDIVGSSGNSGVHAFEVQGTEALRIDKDRHLLIGHTASLWGDQKLQVASTDSTGSLLLARYTNNSYSSYLNFFKSRNSTIVDDGSGTIVQAGDILGNIGFYADDATANRALAAEIQCVVATTPGTNDMPGRLEFKVSPDNSDTPATRFHIDDEGARVTGLFEAYPSSTSTVSAGTFYNNSTGASADCRIVIKTYANQGADPYIKFDSGGTDYIVGQKYEGTTNNYLALGAGASPSSSVKGIKVVSGGAVYVESEFNMMEWDGGSEAAKFMDVGFQGHDFTMRRTTAADGSHANFIHVNSSNVVSGDFNDTSDEKLKENIVSIPDGAIADIKKLRPVTFDWKDSKNENDVSGFIAQEVKTVLPNLISGDEYDPTPKDSDRGSKGGIKGNGYSINSVGVTAHLTKALQEAIAKIETLETKVAALESS